MTSLCEDTMSGSLLGDSGNTNIIFNIIMLTEQREWFTVLFSTKYEITHSNL